MNTSIKLNKFIVIMILFLFIFCVLPIPELNNSYTTSEPDGTLASGQIFMEPSDNTPSTLSTPQTRGVRYLEDYIHLDDAAVQLTVMSEDESDNAYEIGGGEPIATGDIDNDGISDLILGCPYADGYQDNNGNAGQVMIVYGREQTHPYTIYDQADKDLNDIGLYIHGADVWDMFGFSIACGDIDGDEYDDLIVGAFYGDGKNNLRSNSGEVYVMYGRSRSLFTGEIDLHSTAPDLIIYGENGNDWSGFSVGVGNVVGDSRDDIIIGAVYADPPGRTNAGRVYIIEGDTRSALGTEIDLRTSADIKLNGSRGSDWTGFKVLAEDLNNDQRDDIIIGTPFADYRGRTNSGITYVVYGKQSFSNILDLRTDADIILGGAGGWDYCSYSLAVGNINGDSYNDLMVGAPAGDGPNNGQTQSGELYIVYGSPTISSTIDFNQAEQDIVIYGENAHDWFGYSVASGNVNNDSYDDILIGAPYADGENDGKLNCGDSFLIFGNSTSSLGSNIDPRTESEAIFYGVDSSDLAGRYVELGDIDGDGHEDNLISAAGADGPNNARDAVGEFYIVYGAPPKIEITKFELIDGDVNGKTIFSRYKEYTFRVNATNLLGYNDFKSVTLTLNPLGYHIAYRWNRLKNEFIRINDPLNLVDCVSAGSDATHDSNYNYSIDFKFKFNWNFSKNFPISCKVAIQGEKALLDEKIYPGVFKVISKLNFHGEIDVEGEIQGELNNDSWIKGGEELTFGDPVVVYDGTTNYYPPITEYSLGIDRNSYVTKFFPPELGKKITLSIQAPELTITCDYKLRILDIPEDSDNSSFGLILRVDNDVPPPPSYVICKADSFNESNEALFDNDPEVYLDWGAVKDKGSGTARYYYGLENFEGTNNSKFAELSKLLLKDLPEGQNTIFVWAEDAVGNIGLASSTQIYIDIIEIEYSDFTPSGNDWYTSKSIDCSIRLFDLSGSGVDSESIEYWNINKQSWYPIQIDDNNDPSSIVVSLKAEFSEGSDNLIKFRANDLAGNGPTESKEYYFKIDSRPVTFSGVSPDPKTKLSSELVRCYINTHDLGGSGVNISTIQYSYSSNGVGNYSAWTNKKMAIIANQTESTDSVSCMIDLNFQRGSDNYIRWRAKDIAGNGYTTSDDYAIWLNELPVIVVEQIDDTKITSNTDIKLNAQNTYDPDDDLDSLQYSWHSNVSGPLGMGELLNTKLSVGDHLITVVVFDGLDNATHSFELSVLKPSTSKEGSSQFGMGEDVDNLLFALILLIIIIVILSIFINSRERKKRKALEEREKISGRYLSPEISYIPAQSQYRPMIPGGEAGAVARPSITDVTASPAISTPANKQEPPQLSSVGVSARASARASAVSGTGAVTAPSSSAVGQQIPKLPPAILSGTSGSGTAGTQQQAPAQKPMGGIAEEDLDPKKKLELLDKKMLLGEISIDLYNKLSKRYEEKLNDSPTPAQTTPKSTSPTPTPTTPAPTPSTTPTAPTPVPTRAQPQVQKKQPEMGITPDDIEIQKKLKAEPKKKD